jgi:hypothetical protein
MPYVTADDGVKIYYEDVGQGLPIIFEHESAGDFVATSRKSAILGAATAASLITPAATRPQTFKITSRPIHRIGLAMMSGRSWMR